MTAFRLSFCCFMVMAISLSHVFLLENTNHHLRESFLLFFFNSNIPCKLQILFLLSVVLFLFLFYFLALLSLKSSGFGIDFGLILFVLEIVFLYVTSLEIVGHKVNGKIKDIGGMSTKIMR